MQIKQFEGASMADILSRIRKTLGEDALILSTRKKKTNGLGAFTEEVYEVSAAVDRSAPVAPPAAARRFIPPAYRAPVGPARNPVLSRPAPEERTPQGPAPEGKVPEAPAARTAAPFEAFLSFEKEIVPLKEEIRSLKGFLEKIAEERRERGSGGPRSAGAGAASHRPARDGLADAWPPS
jgi:flagellar biosynthesis protein FlhF